MGKLSQWGKFIGRKSLMPVLQISTGVDDNSTTIRQQFQQHEAIKGSENTILNMHFSEVTTS